MLVFRTLGSSQSRLVPFSHLVVPVLYIIGQEE